MALIYPFEYPGLQPVVNNLSPMRSVDFVAQDTLIAYMASRRCLNSPVAICAPGTGTTTTLANPHVFYLGCVVPPGCVGVRVHCKYEGRSPIIAIDAQTSPTWSGRKIEWSTRSKAEWVSSIPWTGGTAPADGQWDFPDMNDALAMPQASRRMALVKVSIETANLIGTYVPRTAIYGIWFEPLFAPGVAI